MKVTLQDITSSVLVSQVVNANNDAVELWSDSLLSRDGSTPNHMLVPLQMNGERITNVGAPTASTDAARLVDVQNTALPTITIPAVAGQSGKFLSNDGSNLLWSEDLQLTDGITAPSTVAGKAFIYVDSADGDLKVKFGDGTVKTLATDT